MDSQFAVRKRKSESAVENDLNNANKRIALLEFSVTQQVFATPMLLEKIVGNLSKEQLLKFRSVNQACNASACKHLRKTLDLYTAPMLYSFHHLIQMQSCSSKPAKTRIELLTETIARSLELDLIFPCVRFSIHDLQLQSAVFQKFFFNYGQAIQKVYLSTYHLPNKDNKGSEMFRLLRNLLHYQLPNLRELGLAIHPNFFVPPTQDYFEQLYNETGCSHFSPETSAWVWENKSCGPNCFPRSLPKLKQLSISGVVHVPILKYVLRAAVNLEEIHLCVKDSGSDREKIMDAIVAHDKARFVSSLNLLLYQDLLRPIEDLAETSSRIKTLKLRAMDSFLGEEWKITVGKIVSKFFTSNAQSLESLKIFPFSLFPPFHVPLLPKLHSLEIYYDGWYWCQHLYLFPPSFKMSRVFPQLKALSIQTDLCHRMNESLFETSLFGASYADEVLTLKSLDFKQQPGEMCTLSLSKMLPNLVSLNMGVLSNIPQAFKAFWKLAYLKTLGFSLKSASGNNEEANIDRNLAVELETAFTGFSKETCEQLTLTCDRMDSTKIEDLRVDNSMLGAKCLRELNIRIEDLAKEEWANDRCPLLSHVSGQFAFLMCPQVQVHIQVYATNPKNVEALKNSLRPVSRFVTSVTESKRYNYWSLKPRRCLSCQV